MKKIIIIATLGILLLHSCGQTATKYIYKGIIISKNDSTFMKVDFPTQISTKAHSYIVSTDSGRFAVDSLTYNSLNVGDSLYVQTIYNKNNKE